MSFWSSAAYLTGYKNGKVIEHRRKFWTKDGDWRREVNFFYLKGPYREHLSTTKNSYISSTVDEKKIMLNKYYSELYKRNYSAGKTSLFDFVVVVVIFALVWGCYFLFLVFTKCFFYPVVFRIGWRWSCNW